MSMDRKSEMIKLRTVDSLSLQEIGNVYGISRERVRQIIGSLPRPKRKKSLEELLYEKVVKTDTCWIWTGAKTGRGYGHVRTEIVGVGNYTHRLSWFIEYGPIPEKMLVCHACGNPLCVRPSHLFLSTRSINIQQNRDKRDIQNHEVYN
jgi:hypothetical protein